MDGMGDHHRVAAVVLARGGFHGEGAEHRAVGCASPRASARSPGRRYPASCRPRRADRAGLDHRDVDVLVRSSIRSESLNISNAALLAHSAPPNGMASRADRADILDDVAALRRSSGRKARIIASWPNRSCRRCASGSRARPARPDPLADPRVVHQPVEAGAGGRLIDLLHRAPDLVVVGDVEQDGHDALAARLAQFGAVAVAPAGANTCMPLAARSRRRRRGRCLLHVPVTRTFKPRLPASRGAATLLRSYGGL